MLDPQSGRKRDIVELRARAGAFAMREIAPHLEAWSSAGGLPRSLFRSFAEEGFAGLMVPPELGGSGLDMRHTLALTEGLMDHLAFAPMVSLMLATNSIAPLLARYAEPELRRELLPDIIAGKTIGTLAITERESASDLKNSLRTSARSDGDDWIITGEKIYITNGPIADIVLVLCRTGQGQRIPGMSLIAVPSTTPGFSTEYLEKLGLHASPTGRLQFDRCRVSKRFTVGSPGSGFLTVNEALMGERLLVAAGASAFALACLSRAVDAAGFRDTGDLALQVARMTAGRALCYEVADADRRGEFISADTSLVKFTVCEAARRAIESCRPYFSDPAARRWFERISCDARVLTLFIGASEAMRETYSLRLLGQTRRQQQRPARSC